MAAPVDVPCFPIAIDAKDFDNDVMKLFAELRPTWKREEMQMKVYSEGYINQMRRFHLSEDAGKQDAIIVRVFGASLEQIVDRKKEFLAMQLAQAAGCFTPILAVFKNGVAYKYIPGRTLTQADLNDPRVIRAVTRKLAQLHTLDINKVHLVDCNGDTAEFDRTYVWGEKTNEFMTQYPDKLPDPEDDKIFQEHGYSKDELMKITEEIMPILLGALPLGLVHGDFHSRNILFDDETGIATFVDYEVSDFRQQLSDLNNLLQNRELLETLGVVQPDEPQLTEDALLLWKRSYMEAKYEILGKDPANIPEEVMEAMDVALRLLEILFLPTIAMFSVIMSLNKDFALPMINLLPGVKQKWTESKHEIPELVKRYRQLTAAGKD